MQRSLEYNELAGRYSGCLLGGAVGDALGRPVEFLAIGEIRKQFGPEGIRDFERTEGGIGTITDDTQMTLFTAEGLLLARRKAQHAGNGCDLQESVYQAYRRWLKTQGATVSDMVDVGWLLNVPQLHHRRGPGSTCLSALESGRMGTIDNPINNGKGCGGIMRIAPVGLYCATMRDTGDASMTTQRAFEIGCDCAAITHGHPHGYLPAGFLATVIFLLVSGKNLEGSISSALGVLSERPEREKCALAAQVNHSLRLKRNKKPGPETVERFGGGWEGDEALSISIYCALAAEGDFAAGVRLAVNHSGDSDSTGSITGNILGALLGKGAIPVKWLSELELADVLEETALTLLGQCHASYRA
jgi:ADP-ribosyl-[dinitrogen reductase] hydrolase